MSKLTRFIECELDRNSWLFSEAYGSFLASLDFINNILLKEDLTTLTTEEKDYIYKIKEEYYNLIKYTKLITESLAKYKEAYFNLYDDSFFE